MNVWGRGGWGEEDGDGGRLLGLEGRLGKHRSAATTLSAHQKNSLVQHGGGEIHDNVADEPHEPKEFNHRAL